MKLKGPIKKKLLKCEYYNFFAYHDALTKLPNRRQFNDILACKLAAGKKGAVILLDLDDFKGINDTLGHIFGDRVLEVIAERLSEIANDRILVSRFGGDEFLMLAERGEAPEELIRLIHKIKDAFTKVFLIDHHEIEIRFSMGISLFPEDGTDVDLLIMNADLAMYSVKDTGKNNYKYFNNSMMSSRIRKSGIETLLKDAIENDRFSVAYQPKIDLKTGNIYGYEALLRLQESGISPAEFIPIAEINGSIVKIGRIITEKAISQIASWKKSGFELKPVSVNFSANQVHDSGYIRFLGQMMKKYDVEPRFIELEITGNIFLKNKQTIMTFLKKLKEMGIGISIDDFGAGYSCLNYLTFLPVDKIKLDPSINVKFLAVDSKVMENLISLIHSLGMKVIAEGIETLEQVDRLKAAECDYIQGNIFSKPLTPEQIGKMNKSDTRN